MKRHTNCVFVVRALLAAALLNNAVPASSAYPNPRFAQGAAQGVVAAEAGNEISGVAASIDNPSVLWVHGDSGNGETLWAINSKGALLGAYTLPGIKTLDCEGIAIGPGPRSGVCYVYWGDIGDNAENRSQIAVYRFPEPSVSLTQSIEPVRRMLSDVVTVKLKYPDGPHNAESLMVDPIEGDLFVGTKTKRKTRFYRAARADLLERREIQLTLAAEIDFDIASDASISPSGAEILVRQEDFAWLVRRLPGQSVADALSVRPVEVPVIGTPAEPNGEAIGFDGSGQGYFTISEGSRQPLNYFRRLGRNASPAPKVLIPRESKWKYSTDSGEQMSSWRELTFNDSAWATAEAPFRFAERNKSRADQDRVPGSSQRSPILFRRAFESGKLKPTEHVVAKLLCSDSPLVYLNGHEVKLLNRDGTADRLDSSIPPVADHEQSWLTFELDDPRLLPGKNIVAIALPCKSPDDCKPAFDLQLLVVQKQKSAR